MDKTILDLASNLYLGGTGSLRAFYGFGGGTETKVVFNNLYTTGEQFSGIHPLQEKLTAISVGSTHTPVSDATTSGRFIGTDALELVGNVPTGEWTFYIDYLKDEITRDKACVLVSTMDTPLTTSGFNFGVNGSNRPYVEFRDGSGTLKTFTHPLELSKENLISVSRMSNVVDVIVHDKLGEGNILAKFDVSGMSPSSSWVLGGVKTLNPSTPNSDPNYERFSGYMSSFILYEGAQMFPARNSLSEPFFYDHISSGGSTQTIISGVENTGVSYNPTGITGTGLIGESIAFKKTVNGIDVYGNSGISGTLTGATVSIFQGTGYFTGITTSSSGTSITYDNPRLRQHGDDSIIFTKTLDSEDTYEVRSFYEQQEGESLKGGYLGFNNSYYTDSGYSGGTQNINVYLGGTGQYSGSEYYVLNQSLINFTGMKVVTGDNAPPFIYDKTTGNQNVSVYTGSLGTITFTEDDFFGRDVFFASGDGGVFGRKLLSGSEWSGFSNRIEVKGSGLGSGKFFFLPMVSESFSSATGVPQTYNKLSFPLMNEQVWLNGLRQQEGADYIKTSSLSLLNSNNRISGFVDVLYGDTEDFFNI